MPHNFEEVQNLCLSAFVSAMWICIYLHSFFLNALMNAQRKREAENKATKYIKYFQIEFFKITEIQSQYF